RTDALPEGDEVGVAWRPECRRAERSEAEALRRWAPGAVPRVASRGAVAVEDACRGAGARSAVARNGLHATRRAAAAQARRGGRVKVPGIWVPNMAPPLVKVWRGCRT